jgi:hypothetical protein
LEITVQLKPKAAAEFTHEAQPTPETEQLARSLKELGLSLQPMHPGQGDPTLASYFTIEVPDRKTADRALEALRGRDAVEAAYVKPAAEHP